MRPILVDERQPKGTTMANQAIRETPNTNTESRRPSVPAEPLRPVPTSGAERKRRMAEIIGRVVHEDHDLLLKLAR